MTKAMRPVRRAFTLVELLVVIAIIGTLVGLLLPAVQTAREAGRRASCTNNLKQVGLAIANYEQAKKVYPSGRDTRDQLGVSWAFRLLPFLEQTQIHDAFVKTARVDDASNATAMRTPVSTFYCPSRRAPAADRNFDNNDQTPVVLAAAAGGDYAANAGTYYNYGATGGEAGSVAPDVAAPAAHEVTEPLPMQPARKR